LCPKLWGGESPATSCGVTFSRPGGMNVTTYANRDQIPTTPPSCGLGARDRWLAGVLAGWLGQMADVLHRDTPASKDWALETCCLGCQSRRFAGEVPMPIGGRSAWREIPGLRPERNKELR